MKLKKYIFIFILFLITTLFSFTLETNAFVDTSLDFMQRGFQGVQRGYGIFRDNFDIVTQTTYIGDAGDSDFRDHLAFQVGLLHKESQYSGHFSFGMNPTSLQLSLRRIARHDHLFGGSRMYIEPSFLRLAATTGDTPFVYNTYGSFFGIIFTESILVDLGAGFKMWSESEGVGLTPVYRLQFGIEF